MINQITPPLSVKPELSVIIPVYNLENYLNDCVESIVAQNIDAMEIILVDDGSTDASPQLCDQLALRYPQHVRTIHKPNGGVNTARNAGLDAACGEFITMVDGDDIIKPGTFAEALAFIRRNQDVDMVQYPEINVRDGHETLWGGYPPQDIVLRTQHDMMTALIGRLPTIPGGLCGKIYASGVWKNLRLDENMQFCEDMVIMPLILEHCRAAAAITRGGYCYIMRDGSASHSPYTPKKRLDVSRLKMSLFKTALKYGIDTGRWWNEAVAAVTDAWVDALEPRELTEAMTLLRRSKCGVVRENSPKMMVRLAWYVSPRFAARVNKAILRLRRALKR